MARTLEFDYTNALDKATRLFWKTGYAGTPLRDLLKSMGIGEGSFYNTLKSKQRAYLESLKYYNATVGHRRAALSPRLPRPGRECGHCFATCSIVSTIPKRRLAFA
jgi:TetR/AcrR family transcriptional regulator, transcriptional repressor for nem operon